jgi:hypothetical protein
MDETRQAARFGPFAFDFGQHRDLVVLQLVARDL